MAQKVSTSDCFANVRLLPVAGVLAAHHVVRFQRAHGFEDLGFLILDGSKVPGSGRLHGKQGDDLKEVVLNHVAQTAGGFVNAPRLPMPKFSDSVTWMLAT